MPHSTVGSLESFLSSDSPLWVGYGLWDSVEWLNYLPKDGLLHQFWKTIKHN